MHNFHRRHTLLTRAAAGIAVASLSLLTACGSDDDDTSTTTTEATATTGSSSTSSAAAAFPSEEFCNAQADLEAAQDGAQRNTAIGQMQDALGDDAPSEISDALDTLLEGDLSPEQYTAAQTALASACS